MTTKLKFVKVARDPRGGAPRHYFRYRGKTTRLRGQPGSPEYLRHHAELIAAINGKQPPIPSPAVIKFRPKRHIDRMLAPAPAERPTIVAHMPGSVGWVV